MSQAQRVMANLAVALAAAGAELTDVAKTTVYVASRGSRADLLNAWQVVRDAFGDHDAPGTLLGWQSSAIRTSSSSPRRWRSPAVGWRP